MTGIEQAHDHRREDHRHQEHPDHAQNKAAVASAAHSSQVRPKARSALDRRRAFTA
jgi:hypothetical protein